MITRVFLVMAACLLVVAFALAILPDWDMSLQDALASLDANAPVRLRADVTWVVGAAIWQHAAEPLLVRPSWLIPAALGLICVGAAVTAYHPPDRRTKRRSISK